MPHILSRKYFRSQDLGEYSETSIYLFVLHIFLKNEENKKVKRYLQIFKLFDRLNSKITFLARGCILAVFRASERPMLLILGQEEHTQHGILPFHFVHDTPHPISGNAGGC